MQNGFTNILRNATATVVALSLGVAAHAQAPASDHITVQLGGAPSSCSTSAGNGTFVATAWTFGGQNNSNPAAGAAGGAGRAALQDLTVTKPFDECSTAIFQAMVTGKHLSSVILTHYDGSNRPLMTVQLTEVFVNTYQLTGTASGAPAEVVAFSFAKITIADAQNNAKSCWDQKMLMGC